MMADIFGDDDSDAEPEPNVAEPAAAPAEPEESDEEEGDRRVNRLLMGRAKEQKKKEKKKKRSRDDGAGKKRKRLEHGDADAALFGEEGGPSGAAGAGDDPDSDSGSGSEAMEEGGKKDVEGWLKGLKHKRGGPNWDRNEQKRELEALQERMEKAAEEDDDACSQEPPQPALAKVSMLEEVTAILAKRQYHEIMIECGFLLSLSRWLRPMNDGSLVTLQVRKKLLPALLRIDIDETALGALRSSGIGKYVKLLTLHARELPENRQVALKIVEKWSRPVFGTSEKYHAADLPARIAPVRVIEKASLDPQRMPNAAHARVPRPIGMDFKVVPQSTVQAASTSKINKDSVKGRLKERIVNGKKKQLGVSQAVTLSVEGRNLDRLS